MAARGEDDCRAQDERAARPGVGPQVFAEQLDSKPGAEGGLDVQEDPGTRCGNVMNAPVP